MTIFMQMSNLVHWRRVVPIAVMTSFAILFSPKYVNGADSDCEDCWSPKLSFDIENSGVEQTLVFISGYGYGLNSASNVLKSKGQQNYYCNGGKVVDSQELVEILNEHLSGQVTSEQVSSVITFGLIQKYPCSTDFN